MYEHFTFAKAKFKKDFIVMNQKVRQTASSSIEKYFYKLLNNSNCGTDCRNNIDNCYLEPIYDDFLQISYIKIFLTIFCIDTYRDFFSPNILRGEVTQTFQSKIFALNKEEITYEARKKFYEKNG